MINYLDKLQEKCKIPDNFMSIISSLFDRLIDFGYVNNSGAKKLTKKLYDNIDTLILGKTIGLDYKSGYYDAVKKELYIKDPQNIESIYLRIMYVITTTEISEDNFAVGYSTATLSKSNYKIIHKNFGINRAVVSNLVCRLLYTVPETLSIVPTYRKFDSDFLGNKIRSDNDIYFLEGKILTQICYTLNLNEEDLYGNLFSSSPNKFLKKFFSKSKIDNEDLLLNEFDNVSRTYSNYNKLCFLNNKLNSNYISIKKNILNDVSNDLKKENQKIKLAIETALIKLSPDELDEDENSIVENSLSEKINELEEKIISLISSIQKKLVNILINEKDNYSIISYSIKLKTLEKIMIIPNSELKKTLFETITLDLLSNGENTASNLIEKIKYSIVNEIISSDKYIKIYKNMYFKKLDGLGFNNNTSIIALNVDNEFMQLVEISSLNKVTKNLINNTRKLQLDSLGYLLNNPSAASTNISAIEKIITSIRNHNSSFNNVKIEDIYMTNYKDFKIIVISRHGNFDILKLTTKNNEITTKAVKLSDNFSIFSFSNSKSNLPTVYKEKKKGPLKKILSLFGII